VGRGEAEAGVTRSRLGLAALAVVRWTVGLAVVVGAVRSAAAAPPPRGERRARPAPTHVVVRLADLDAGGVLVRVAPRVPVVAAGVVGHRPGARVEVTLAGGVDLSGRMEASALGAVVGSDVELRSVDGADVLGRARAGALVVPVGAGPPGMTVCDTVGLVQARVALPAGALGAEPRELVFPVASGRRAALSAAAALVSTPAARGGGRARLARGASVVVLGEDGGWARVRTYGGVELEGFVPAERLGPAEGTAPLEDAGAGSALTPTHEALVDAFAFADGGGRRRIGTLRGGTLLSVGIETVGGNVKVMTSGRVVGEVWVPAASLRPLEPEVWRERP
jgi:hypothetical protein